jgi:hypothetical protein
MMNKHYVLNQAKWMYHIDLRSCKQLIQHTIARFYTNLESKIKSLKKLTLFHH